MSTSTSSNKYNLLSKSKQKWSNSAASNFSQDWPIPLMSKVILL